MRHHKENCTSSSAVSRPGRAVKSKIDYAKVAKESEVTSSDESEEEEVEVPKKRRRKGVKEEVVEEEVSEEEESEEEEVESFGMCNLFPDERGKVLKKSKKVLATYYSY